MANKYHMQDGLLSPKVAEPRPPAAGEVLVSVEASSMNYRDLAIQAGHYPSRNGVVPLSDGAGTVLEVGSGVEGLVAGARVASCFFPFWEAGPATSSNHRASLGCDIDGMLSKFSTLPASSFVEIPEYLTTLEAATLPCAALTAWSALTTRGQLTPGEHVLIQGTGGVAIFALQFAKAMGAEVSLISSSDEKLERAKSMGADHTFNYVAYPDWDSRIVNELGGEPIDLVIEVGGSGTLQRSLNCLRVGGRVSVIGVLSGNEVNMSISSILSKWVALYGITVSHREDFLAMLRFMQVANITPVVDQINPLADAANSYGALAKGLHFGKIVIDHRG